MYQRRTTTEFISLVWTVISAITLHVAVNAQSHPTPKL